MRDAGTALLGARRNLAVESSDASIDDVFRCVRRFRPHVILLGTGETTRDIGIVRAIHEQLPNVGVIVVESSPGKSAVLEFLKERISDFVDRDSKVSDLIFSIRAVASGKRLLPQLLSDLIDSQTPSLAIGGEFAVPGVESSPLTQRQRDVVRLICKGYPNKQIANELCVSVHTIKSHIHSILERLQLQSRLEIARFGTEPAAPAHRP